MPAVPRMPQPAQGRSPAGGCRSLLRASTVSATSTPRVCSSSSTARSGRPAAIAAAAATPAREPTSPSRCSRSARASERGVTWGSSFYSGFRRGQRVLRTLRGTIYQKNSGESPRPDPDGRGRSRTAASCLKANDRLGQRSRISGPRGQHLESVPKVAEVLGALGVVVGGSGHGLPHDLDRLRQRLPVPGTPGHRLEGVPEVIQVHGVIGVPFRCGGHGVASGLDCLRRVLRCPLCARRAPGGRRRGCSGTCRGSGWSSGAAATASLMTRIASASASPSPSAPSETSSRRAFPRLFRYAARLGWSSGAAATASLMAWIASASVCVSPVRSRSRRQDGPEIAQVHGAVRVAIGGGGHSLPDGLDRLRQRLRVPGTLKPAPPGPSRGCSSAWPDWSGRRETR